MQLYSKKPLILWMRMLMQALTGFFFRGKNNVISLWGVIFFYPKDPDPCLEEDWGFQSHP